MKNVEARNSSLKGLLSLIKIELVNFLIDFHLIIINRSDEEIEIEEHKYVPIDTSASTSNDYYNIATHPRFSHLHSESRRKSTPPIRIQQMPSAQSSSSSSHHSVRVRGVVRDPNNARCLYLLVDSSPDS